MERNDLITKIINEIKKEWEYNKFFFGSLIFLFITWVITPISIELILKWDFFSYIRILSGIFLSSAYLQNYLRKENKFSKGIFELYLFAFLLTFMIAYAFLSQKSPISAIYTLLIGFGIIILYILFITLYLFIKNGEKNKKSSFIFMYFICIIVQIFFASYLYALSTDENSKIKYLDGTEIKEIDDLFIFSSVVYYNINYPSFEITGKNTNIIAMFESIFSFIFHAIIIGYLIPTNLKPR